MASSTAYNNNPAMTNSSPVTSNQNVNSVVKRVVRKVPATTTTLTVKKKPLNGTNGGGSSVGTSEDGEEATSSVPEDEEYQVDMEDEIEDADEVDHDAHHPDTDPNHANHHSEDVTLEDDLQQIKDQLSTIANPTVKDILSRSALLTWQTPVESETTVFTHQELQYEILLSDSAKHGKYKSIFKGQSLSCRIQDLRPGVEYSVCLRVHYQGIQGRESPATIFNTPPCAPDTPNSPKLISRTKSTLQLRWNAAMDNGSHIQQYVLEYDCGSGGQEFMEVCRTKGKQYTLTRLQPSTTYR